MSLIDNYLYNGEKVLSSMSRKNLLGKEEEIAATNMRIIRAKGEQHSDIKYGYLTSIGNYTRFNWGRMLSAASTLLLAILFLIGGSMIPGTTTNFSNNFQNGLNDTFNSVSVGIGGGNNTTQAGMASPTAPTPTLSPNNGGPGGDQGQPNVSLQADVRGPINAVGSLISTISYGIGLFLLAIGIFQLAVFLLTIKWGIIITTPTETYAFRYGKEQKAQAEEFLKVVRAAEEEKIKVLQQCMPELFLKQKT